MSTHAWALSGLIAGVLAGAVIMVALVALAPDPQPRGGAVPPVAASPSVPAGGQETLPPVPSPSGGSTSASASPAPSIPGPGATSTIMHIGEPAPVLALPQVGGGFIDLAALRGRPVWILFLSSSCEECAADLKLMASYVSRYAGDGLVGILVDVGDSETAAAAFARRNGITLPIGLDLDGHARDEWEVVGLPSHVWVDRLQVVRDVAPASIGTESMAGSLALILPGVTVTP